MEGKESNIFSLGLLEIPNLERNSQVETAYLQLTEIYNEISAIIDSDIQTLFDKGIGETESFEIYKELYDNFARSYLRFVDSIRSLLVYQHQISFHDVDFQDFVDRAFNLSYTINSPKFTSFMVLPKVGVMRHVSKFLYEIYLSLVDKDLPIFKYMRDGAQMLGYSDKQMFNRMYGAMRQKNKLRIIGALVNGLMQTKNRKDIDILGSYYGEMAAMADYSYAFTSPYYHQVHIKPVAVSGDLAQIYHPGNCSINIGMGEQVALFAVDNRHYDAVLSFAGTAANGLARKSANCITDIVQILYGPEECYLAAAGLLMDVLRTINGRILVVGHSLGGGLMQFACAAADNDRVEGVGFNSAGLSSYSRKALTKAKTTPAHFRITHICAATDWVSSIGYQIGHTCYVDTHHLLSHSQDHLNQTLNGRLISCYM